MDVLRWIVKFAARSHLAFAAYYSLRIVFATIVFAHGSFDPPRHAALCSSGLVWRYRTASKELGGGRNHRLGKLLRYFFNTLTHATDAPLRLCTQIHFGTSCRCVSGGGASSQSSYHPSCEYLFAVRRSRRKGTGQQLSAAWQWRSLHAGTKPSALRLHHHSRSTRERKAAFRNVPKT